MDAWLQSLAVGVAVLVGLVSPAADLQLDVSALRGPSTVEVQAEVAGAVTPEVRDYLLAGNSLVLVVEAQWGSVRTTQSRTIEYRAWEGEFTVRGNGDPLVTKDAITAFRTWRSLGRWTLGTLTDLQPALGSPLVVRATLKPGAAATAEGTVRALWGYKVPETKMVYRSWLELPR